MTNPTPVSSPVLGENDPGRQSFSPSAPAGVNQTFALNGDR